MADGGHAGFIGWCMFDYQTHRDFGSGDRICYHGVMDAFRNPKTAAALYASQSDASPVLEIGSSMDIGDYPGGNIGPIYAFTNADEVELYKNDQYVTTFKAPEDGTLPHEPILIDDKIGELLETQEGFAPRKADLIRRCLLEAERVGFTNLSFIWKLRLAWAMFRYRMTFSDGVDLFSRYVGNWGGKTTTWRFAAKRGGETIATAVRTPGSVLHLEARASKQLLEEGDTYDACAVRIRVLDENNNPAPYAALPLKLSLTGAAELIGPDTVTAEGGMTGTYLRTAGRSGTATLRISSPRTEPVSLFFEINA